MSLFVVGREAKPVKIIRAKEKRTFQLGEEEGCDGDCAW